MRQVRKRGFLYRTVLTLIVGALICFYLERRFPEEKATPIQVIRVQGQSMAPFIRSGDLIEVEVEFYKTHKISRGEIVLLQLPTVSHHLVKRVIALPQDRVHLNLNSLYVNGVLAKNLSGVEYEIQSDEFRAEIEMAPIVPENSLLVLGEPRRGSYDSSRLGFIPIEAVRGRARVPAMKN